MSVSEIHELCDQADAIDPEAYFVLCEKDLDDDEFVQGLQDIIEGNV